jgi:hypothetical protein
MIGQARAATRFAALMGFVALSACQKDRPSTSATSAASAALAACDHVFDVLFVQCAQTAPPTDKLAPIRQRYEQVCERGMSLPGVAVSPQQLSDCASLVAAVGCRGSLTLEACLARGNLEADASCTQSMQCQSNACSKPFLFDPDSGSSQMLACGSCQASIPVGQPCGNQVPQCAPGSACAVVLGGNTCVAVGAEDVGGACSLAPGACKAGLYCDAFTQKCASQGRQGEPCTESAPCAFPLSCMGLVNSSCQSPGQTGAQCLQDSDCVQGLVCNSMLNRCSAVQWAEAGQPCSSTVRCLVGDCPSSGSCPLVISDGQPCSPQLLAAATCDAFASCRNGICSLGEGANCP